MNANKQDQPWVGTWILTPLPWMVLGGLASSDLSTILFWLIAFVVALVVNFIYSICYCFVEANRHKTAWFLVLNAPGLILLVYLVFIAK